ncbi:MAG: hypothetical protein GY927_02060 [bacterium]|nr:hypothetical protein [bacterium]
MSIFIIQSLFLITVTYFLGANVGCWMRKLFTNSASMLHRASDKQVFEPALTTVATAAVGTAAAVGATRYAGEEGEASIEIKRPDVQPVEEPADIAPVERETISYVDRVPPVTIDEAVVPLKDLSTDDLTKIKGIGLPVALELKRIGINRFEQVARWSEEDIANISDTLGFSGRIERENWMAQAHILATGNELGFTTHQLTQAEQNTPSSDIGKLISDANSARDMGGDDLTRVVGIDTNIAAQLKQIGVTSFAHIANLNKDEVAAIGRRLGIAGRIESENWVRQARNLDTTTVYGQG